MRSILRRVLCAMLSLCMLLPTLALAEQDATGLRFSLAFQMDAEAFSPEQQSLMTGLADLMNALTLEGTLETSFTGCFDLNTQLMLNAQEETRTSLRVFGTEAAWGIQSSLLGEETLFVNMIALLEFSMKIYFHLDIPLQRVALLASSYVHTSALDSMVSAWRQVMLAKEGKRTISKKQVLALAQEMADIAASDRAFQFWVQALTLEAGYDEAVTEALADLPAWAESFVDKGGITVAIQGSTETWSTGGTTLFTRTEEDTISAWSLALPATTNGYAIAERYTAQPSGEAALQLTITDAADEATVLALSLQLSGVDSLSDLAFTFPFSLQLDMTGEALKQETHLLVEGQAQGSDVTISILNAQTHQPQLTVLGTVESYTPSQTPAFTNADIADNFNLLSMNDITMKELLSRITSPLFNGLVPLLVQVPVSTVQSLMNLLEEHQVLELLLSGGSLTDDEYFD